VCLAAMRDSTRAASPRRRTAGREARSSSGQQFEGAAVSLTVRPAKKRHSTSRMFQPQLTSRRHGDLAPPHGTARASRACPASPLPTRSVCVYNAALNSGIDAPQQGGRW
jgi:hypothetical protein